MSKKTRLDRILIAALLALVFAGSGVATIAQAADMPMARALYLAGGLSAVLCGIMTTSTPGAFIGGALLALSAGGYALTHRQGLRALPVFFAQWEGGEADAALVALGGRTLLTVAAFGFGILFFLLLYRRELTAMAVMILLAMVIASHAMSRRATLAVSMPALAAAAAAFALTGGVQRDAHAFRVLAPAVLAALIALALLPGQRVTWAPMEAMAERVRSVFEQYFNFTHERIAFSISEEGYNHGGEIDGEAVAMLGGPAQPDPSPVMRVTADGDLLLRGTIRTTYTGYSWVDITPKSRYLYYDLTHRTVRDRVFNLDKRSPEDAFHAVKAQVELLDDGTSTLFVPGRLTRFNMDLSSAVYYNSAGEMFMAREVRSGDRYALEALNADHGEGLRQAAIRGEAENDEQYAAILSAHTGLPQGIEEGLYALTVDLTRDAATAYDKAEAIAAYLRGNMRYRLDVAFPPLGRDFVSWFVLDSREGYCSYFASAMAVMGRIAGLPTRYVEGYFARPGAEGTAVLTGEDAHAWAEVYLKGVGWVAYDPTNGGPAHQGGEGTEEENSDGGTQYVVPNGPEDASSTVAPDSDAAPDTDSAVDDGGDGSDEDGGDADAEPTPTPDPGDSPEGDDTPEDTPEDGEESPEDEPDAASAPPPENNSPIQSGNRRHGPWWIALLLLVLIALATLWTRRRLQATDPMRLCRAARRAQQAAMIAYRANLTLLSQLGQAPASGETPDAFAQRVAKQYSNPDFASFAKAVSYSRYANRPLRKDDVEAGLRAYERFTRGLRPIDRLRYTLTRVFRGLGDFEAIP